MLPSQILVTKTVEKQNHPRIKDVASDCTKDTQSFAARVVNNFALFVVRYVYTVRATPHERKILTMCQFNS